MKVDPISLLRSEWPSVGRSAGACDAVAALAARDASVAVLSTRYPDGVTLLEYMHPGPGHATRNESASLVAVMLREAEAHPLVPRFILQALLPGLLSVGRRLRWGRNGPWDGGAEFCAEMISVTWEVLCDWSGAERPYAALDLLSAVRCRLRRQLFREIDRQSVQLELFTERGGPSAVSVESDLDLLARTLEAADYLTPNQGNVLYATTVLGLPFNELSVLSGVSSPTLRRRRNAARKAMVRATR